MLNSGKRVVIRGVQCAVLIAAGVAVSGCGGESKPAAVASTSAYPVEPGKPSAESLLSENQRLKGEITQLKAQIEDLKQTPQVLLVAVQDAVKAGKLPEAKAALAKLESRFGPSAQLTTAKAEVGQLERVVQARAEEAKRLEALGFYALKPKKDTRVDDMVIQVENLSIGSRWTFDSYDDRFFYRDAKRGEKYVVLRTTLKSMDKQDNPYLPDVGIYVIDGKTMNRVASMSYEFRRWTNHGTFIGLYHDFKNDFAHTQAIPFVAGAAITEQHAGQPFAVVATGLHCHERGEKIGQPEVVYNMRGCGFKNSLTVEDFASDQNQVLGFFNKPKGT